jgi:hypothetical protein
MRYVLWGLHPANLIDTFETEAEARDEVRGLLDAGWQADDLSLGRIDGASGSVIVEGADLAARAKATGSARQSFST